MSKFYGVSSYYLIRFFNVKFLIFVSCDMNQIYIFNIFRYRSVALLELYRLKKVSKWHTLHQEWLTFDNFSIKWWTLGVKIDKLWVSKLVNFVIIVWHQWHTNSIHYVPARLHILSIVTIKMNFIFILLS